MIPAAVAWGPFCGGQALADLLLRAEQDASLLPLALAALSSLDALDKRRVWASYLALNKSVA